MYLMISILFPFNSIDFTNSIASLVLIWSICRIWLDWLKILFLAYWSFNCVNWTVNSFLSAWVTSYFASDNFRCSPLILFSNSFNCAYAFSSNYWGPLIDSSIFLVDYCYSLKSYRSFSVFYNFARSSIFSTSNYSIYSLLFESSESSES